MRIRSSSAIALALVGLVCLGARWLNAKGQAIEFDDITQESGLSRPLTGMMAHAAAWGDMDGDGDLDLYVGGFADRPDVEYQPASGPVANRLFRNVGPGRFEPVAGPVEFYARTSDAVFVDLDNDGLLDLYVTNNARRSTGAGSMVQREARDRRSSLFRNENGRFVEVTAAGDACLAGQGSARAVGVLDYDRDGRLDLLVLEDRFGDHPRSRMCRNLGKFRFQDVTADTGLPGDLFGLGVAIGDLNDDGRPDMFVTDSNRLFVSAGSKYVEPSGLKTTFAWRSVDAEDWPAGAMFADVNRDGRLDLTLGIHHDGARNRIYLNQTEGGRLSFRDVSADIGLPPRLQTKSPHVEVQDFDNDGWPDLYFSAAWMDASGDVTPLVFRNLGLHRGLPRFAPLRQIGKDTPRVYFPAGPSGDYDGDGRIDLFLANWFRGNHSRLLRNISEPHHWLQVKVRGTTMNRMGIGAKVRISRAGALDRDAALVGFQEIGTGYGFASGQVSVAHFGLGNEAVVDVAVTFPDGSKVVLNAIGADRQLTIDQP